MSSTRDDLLVGAAAATVAALCVAFRYLPMLDLPQHYAMVSILAHHHDPAYGFADRFTFDFVGRPYLTVYFLGAGLARLMPLRPAMHIVVALCTIAPLAGTWLLLQATKRRRGWALLAVPLAFGHLWHWGFLNFLFGVGLLMATLALVVAVAERRSWRLSLALCGAALALLCTHIHCVALLLGLAPLFVWGYAQPSPSPPVWRRALLPLAPAALALVLFVARTWAAARDVAPQLDPDWMQRVQLFPLQLAAGIPDPWPLACVATLASFAAVALALRARGELRSALARRDVRARLVCLLAQIALFFALPLNTPTATYVSPRQALLCALFALLLLPSLTGHAGTLVGVAAALFAAASLAIAGVHLQRFDREARDADVVFAAMQPNRRVAGLIFDRTGAHAHPRTFPYVHFAAYYQAEKGGDLASSFARLWNVPIQYRADYTRHRVRPDIDWGPQAFSLDEDLPYFDYLLIRARNPAPPRAANLRVAAARGEWLLLENLRAQPE
jgi:hypothetical protein